MLHNFRLLLDTVFCKRPSWFQAVIITAKRMALKGQEYSLLVLPHMNQFMNEQPLQGEITVAKILAEQVILGVKP